MQDFIYNTPTKVFFGKEKYKQVGKIISDYGFKKIMLQYGKGSIKKTGLYDSVINSLTENGIEVIEVGGVEPNPKYSFVKNAIKVAKETKVELILAVGGGSVLDSCKATALGAKTEEDVWNFFIGKSVPKNALPVASILTISAAGSEMSSSAVITNEQLNVKKGCGTELNRCLFSILSPELTFSVSKYQTACGIVDMMTHTMERYFSVAPDTMLTDELSEALLRSIIKAGEIAIQNPTDYNARATLMWGSSLAHNGLTGCGRENYLAVHQLEHAVSGLYDEVSHGAGLAVLYPAWAEYVYKYNPDRFYKLFTNVFGAKGETKEQAIKNGIDKMREFFKKIGMPSSLSDFNIPKEKLEDLAIHCSKNKTITVKSYIPLGYKEVKEIFNLCF